MEALSFPFMQHALLAGLLVSVATGIMGSLVVANRMVFVTGGIAHAAYGGVGLALFLGIAPLAGAAGFAVAAALVMGSLMYKYRQRADTIIGVTWAAGMAFGILLTDLAPGYGGDVMSYLFGSILAVSNDDLLAMVLLDGTVLAFVLIAYRSLMAMSYDPEFARLRGVPTRALYLLTVVLTALTVVVAIRVVGLILVIALMTIPVFIGEKFVKTPGGAMGAAVLLGALFTLGGLAWAYAFDLSAGASIIFTACAAFFLSLGVRR